MKKILLLSFALLTMAVSMNAQRFAVVDVELVLNKMPEYQGAQDQLDNQAAEWQQEIAKKYDEIKGLYNKYQAEQVLLSESERVEKEEEIVQREQKVRELQKQRFGPDGELFQRRQELVAPVQDKLYTAMEEYANARGYDFLFDKGGSIGIIFAKPEFDKTDDILAKLKLK